MWNQSADESVFEDMAVGKDQAIPKEVCEQDLDEADASAIGRWGEQLVYSYYQEESKLEGKIIKLCDDQLFVGCSSSILYKERILHNPWKCQEWAVCIFSLKYAHTSSYRKIKYLPAVPIFLGILV